ncbi:MAG: carnitine dehydratase [Rhizobiales bacterium 32-66-11]|jgi:alpha-methylacyl-CoA racemase|nr:MAG: carnitine dehydratase [Rhizobiales bacterium 32-66-11]
MSEGKGPLAGVRVVEFAGIGPCPFAGMLLAQMGAEVLRIEREGHANYLPIPERFDLLNTGKTRLALDMKSEAGKARIFEILAQADALIEGYRPGVMERLGLGPEAVHARVPRLVYGRVTGWGQNGPYAQEAGHDINYIAITGALAAIGAQGGPPVPPLNLVGDFAGGLYLCFGVVSALLAARASGEGQVVDAAMVDGAAHLMTFLFGLHQAGLWRLERGSNEADGGFPFYGVYQAGDGRWLAVAAAEMKFRLALLEGIGLDREWANIVDSRKDWARVRAALAAAFETRGRDEWVRLLAGTDSCVSPVLDMAEAPADPHAVARGLFERVDGVVRPAAAPRFSKPTMAPAIVDPADLLGRWGVG